MWTGGLALGFMAAGGRAVAAPPPQEPGALARWAALVEAATLASGITLDPAGRDRLAGAVEDALGRLPEQDLQAVEAAGAQAAGSLGLLSPAERARVVRDRVAPPDRLTLRSPDESDRWRAQQAARTVAAGRGAGEVVEAGDDPSPELLEALRQASGLPSGGEPPPGEAVEPWAVAFTLVSDLQALDPLEFDHMTGPGLEAAG